MDKERFVKELEKMNVNLSAMQLDQLDKYYKLLVTCKKAKKCQ